MRDVLEYTSYRQYIVDYYTDRKAKSAFTWQMFAEKAGFSSPVYLKYVSEGRFNLSEEAALRVASAMSLVEYERDYFCEMVRFDHAKTDEEKKIFDACDRCCAQGENHRGRFLPLFRRLEKSGAP